MFKVRILATAFACALALPAFAQEPVQTPNIGDVAAVASDGSVDAQGGTVSASAVPQLPRVSPVPQTNFFKLSGGDFKNFFSADTARTLAYTSIVAIGSAPWDREGINNGFNIPTTVFQSGNVIGSFAFQVAAGAATYGIAQGRPQPEGRGRWPRHRPRADPVAGDGADAEVHRAARASGRQQLAVLPVRSLVQRVCDGGRAASSLRLEGRRPGVCARQLRRARAHVVEPPPCNRRRHGCGLRHRGGAHRDDDGREVASSTSACSRKSAARRSTSPRFTNRGRS